MIASLKQKNEKCHPLADVGHRALSGRHVTHLADNNERSVGPCKYNASIMC